MLNRKVHTAKPSTCMKAENSKKMLISLKQSPETEYIESLDEGLRSSVSKKVESLVDESRQEESLTSTEK